MKTNEPRDDTRAEAEELLSALRVIQRAVNKLTTPSWDSAQENFRESAGRNLGQASTDLMTFIELRKQMNANRR